MAAPLPAKKPGDPVRVIRVKESQPCIESDWLFVRFEPDSGKLIAEKGGKRIACDRREYDALNFPGSSELYGLLDARPDEPDLESARRSWAKLDLPGALRILIVHARTLDPKFAGIQTVSDFASKIKETEESCSNSIEVLRLEAKRAEAEYGRAPTANSFECDQKDTLLQRWHDIENRLAARQHLHEHILPIMCGFLAALEGLDAAMKNGK